MEPITEKAALLVIDVQAGLFTKTIPVYNADQLLDNICQLMDSAHRAGTPVFVIQHSSDKALPFGSDEWRLHPRVQPAATDHVVHKRHPNAFEGTELQKELDSLGIRCLVLTGLVTHGCVKATCLGAHALGYRVILVADGHSNFHKKAPQVIEEWNTRLSQDAAELRAADEIVFMLSAE